MPKVHSWEDLVRDGALDGRDLEIYYGGESMDRGPIKKVVRKESGQVWITLEWGAKFDQKTGTFGYDSDWSDPEFGFLVDTKFPVVEVGEGHPVFGDTGCEILVVHPQGNNLNILDVRGFPVREAAT